MAIREEKQKEPNYKEKSKSVTVCRWHYTVYPEDIIRKLLEIINEFGKVIVYKINIQKSVVFLNTNNKISEREIKETISLTIASKRIKYLAISLPKETNDLYSKNCKTLMKEIENDRQMERYTCILGLEDSVSLKWPFYPRQSTNSMQSLSNYEWHFSQH